jgi:monoamine oxidase
MPDVIVIGAGVAGLKVARDLTHAGLRVLVLEARDRLGGRVWTRHTAHGPVELGAEFVHGAFDEILGVAKAAHLALRESGGAEESEAERAAHPRHEAFAAIDTLLTHASKTDDESFQQLVDRVDLAQKTKASALMLVEGYHAADPAKLGVLGLQDATAADEQPGAEHQFRFVDGYDGLVEALHAEIVADRCTVQLEAVVTAITWRAGHVVVRLATGAEHAAPRVVVTVPLGVLKAGAIAFSPALPDKERALRRLEMGATARISLQLTHDAWPGYDEFPIWWVSHPAPHPVVTGWGGRRGALALASLDEAALAKVAVRELSAAIGVEASLLKESVLGAFHHDWLNDPFSRGAYSYPGVGGHRAGSELAEPVEATLFFAGEATQSDGRNATVHGAIASGQRAAKQVLAVR